MSIPFTMDPIQGTLDCLVAAGTITQEQADELAKAATTLTSMGMSPQAALSMAMSLATAKGVTGLTDPSTLPPESQLAYAGNLGNENVPATNLTDTTQNLTTGSPTLTFTPQAYTNGLVTLTGVLIVGGESVQIQKQVGGVWYPLNPEDQIALPNGYTVIVWPEASMRLQLVNPQAGTTISAKVRYIPA